MRKLLLTASLAALVSACAPEVPAVCESDADCSAGSCVDGFCVIPAPVIASFAADKETITAGQSATLTFTFENGAGEIDPGVGPVQSGTPVTVSPTTTTTYTLRVKNPTWPEATRAVTVNVLPAPVIASFAPAKPIITEGGSTTLTAVFENGTGTINQGVGAVQSGVAVTVTPPATTTYILTVTSPTGVTVTSNATVTVVPPPSITSFSPADAVVAAGGSTSLVAVFENGTGVVDQGVGPVTSGVGAAVVVPTVKGAITYTLTVTNAAGTSVTRTTTVTISAGPVAAVALERTPAAGTMIADGSLAQSFILTATLEDQYQNRVNDVQVYIASDGVNDLFDPPGSQLSDGNGQATWRMASTRAGTKIVTASALGALGDSISDQISVEFVPGPATKVIYQVQPSNVVAGAAISPPIRVAVVDAFDNVADAATGTVSLFISTNPGGAMLTGGGPVALVGGVATFSAVSLNKSGTGYRLTASSAGRTSAVSDAFNVTPGAPNNLAFVQQPSTVQAGSAISPPVTVEVRDANGNRVTSATNTITLGVTGTHCSGLTGGSASASSGLATFPNVIVSVTSAPATCTLTASSSGLTGATSVPFTVNACATQTAEFTTQPSNVTAGVAMSPAVGVRIKDCANNTVTTATGNVTLSLYNNPGGASLIGTNTASLLSGVATFSDVRLDKAGTGYTLRATPSNTSYGASGASSAFNVTANPNASTTVSTVTAPRLAFADNTDTATVTITVTDAYGNPLAGKSVTLSASGSGNTISQPSGTTNASGVITGTIKTTVAETKTIAATITGTGSITTTPRITFTRYPHFMYALNSSDNTISVLTMDHTTGALIHDGMAAVGPGSRGIAADPLGRYLYVTSYDSHSVHLFTIDAASGFLTYSARYATGTNPWSAAVDPTGKFLYVVNQGSNTVTPYTINAFTGTPSAGTAVATGTAPYGLAIDPTGKFLYVTNYTSANVSAFSINATTGALTTVGTYSTGSSSSHPAIDPSGRFLYVPNYSASSLSVFSINPTSGALTQVGSNVTTTLAGPVSAAVDPQGRFLYVANFNNGTVSQFSIDPGSGALTSLGSAVAANVSSPRLITVDPSGKYVYVSAGGSYEVSRLSINPDTGLLTFDGLTRIRGTSLGLAIVKKLPAPVYTGKYVYSFNFMSHNVSGFSINASTGALTPTANSPYSVGYSYPYAGAVHPSGRYLYVPSQSGNRVVAYSINESTGALATIASYTTQAGPASIGFDPNGDLLFVTCSSAAQIQVFSVDRSNGVLTAKDAKPTGTTPYGVMVDPSGRFLYVANYGSNSVSAFKITADGLTDGAGGPYAAGTNPYFGAIDPSGRYLYVSNSSSAAGGNSISAYSIHPSTGALTALASSPFSTGLAPQQIAIHPSGDYLYVANNSSGTVQLFALDQATGNLTAQSTYPVFRAFGLGVDPSGKYLFATQYTSPASIFPFTIGAAGALTAGTPVSIASGSNSIWVVVRRQNLRPVPAGCTQCQ